MNEQVVTVSSQQTSSVHSVPLSLVDLGKRLLDASKRGDTYEIRSLMSSGAPFTTDWLGTSPLHFAAMHGHLDTVNILLRAGISRDARTKVDRTPLHVAAQSGHFEIVQILLKQHAIIDASDMLKMTPLHWAVENGHTNVVNLLLKHDADTTIIDKFDRSPMDIALGNMQMDIVQLLQNANSQKRPTANQETILEEEVLTTPSADRPDQQSVVIATEEEVSEPSATAATSTAVKEEGGSEEGGNTSVLAALAALAEATSTNNSSSSDAANWLSSHGLSVANSDSATPFTLTEAGKLALTNFMKGQGVTADGGTVMTLVDEDGNQVLLVQQGSESSDAMEQVVDSSNGQETTDLHIDTTKVTQEELIEETVD